MRQDVVEKYGDTWTEAETNISNGAFLLSQWAHGEKLVLQPNPFWFGEAPSLSRIEFFVIEDDVAAFQAYQADELDVVTVPPAALEEVSSVGSPYGDQPTIEPDLATLALFMNYKTAPFDNQLVRKAFGTAIDRDAYTNGVLAGGGVPTTSWVPRASSATTPRSARSTTSTLRRQSRSWPMRVSQTATACRRSSSRW